MEYLLSDPQPDYSKFAELVTAEDLDEQWETQRGYYEEAAPYQNGKGVPFFNKIGAIVINDPTVDHGMYEERSITPPSPGMSSGDKDDYYERRRNSQEYHESKARCNTMNLYLVEFPSEELRRRVVNEVSFDDPPKPNASR
jgi:hypothetical protein